MYHVENVDGRSMALWLCLECRQGIYQHVCGGYAWHVVYSTCRADVTSDVTPGRSHVWH